MAIARGEFSNRGLSGLKIINSTFNPALILEQCPELEHLHIQWDGSTADMPVKPGSGWFPDVLASTAMVAVLRKVKTFALFLPDGWTTNGNYALPAPHAQLLFRNLLNVTAIQICGNGGGDPLDLTDVLFSCPALEELELVYIACVIQRQENSPHKSLRTLRVVGKLDTLMDYPTLWRMARLSPGVVEVVLHTAMDVCAGLTMPALEAFSNLDHLKRLSVPLRYPGHSTEGLLEVLHKIPSLRQLIVSWEQISPHSPRILRAMEAIQGAIKARNLVFTCKVLHSKHEYLFT